MTPEVKPVSLVQFCKRFNLRTPSGKLALKRGRRLMEKRFVFFRDGKEMWTTEQELARVLLTPVVKALYNDTSFHIGTGKEGHTRSTMLAIELGVGMDLIKVNQVDLDILQRVLGSPAKLKDEVDAKMGRSSK